MKMKSALSRIIFFTAVFAFTAHIYGTDWPMWRYDAGRRASTDLELSENLKLLWIRELPEPKRAWPFQYEDYYTGGNPMDRGKLSFDVSYEPIIGKGRVYVSSMVTDKVTAYSLRNGEELWRYYTNGPVRFAPVYWEENLYFSSDDGYLYCVDASNGELHWKIQGSYSPRQVLGNERLISMWPGRGGPVIRDGIIYFATGIVAFEGVFIHAVDALSGEVLWTNSTSGSLWDLHQHGGAYSYGGPAPQGYLAVTEDKLLVPGGRTPPAVFDRHTGEFLYFRQATGMVGKGAGGYQVCVQDDWFFNHNMLYSLEDGAQFGSVSASVLTDDSFIGANNGKLVAYNARLERAETEIQDRLARGAIREQYELETLWESSLDQLEELFLRAGSHLAVSSSNGAISLIRLSEEGIPAETAWRFIIDGEVWNILAGDGQLLVVTKEGRLFCFGEQEDQGVKYHGNEAVKIQPEEQSLLRADSLIQATGVQGGYAFVYGGKNSEFLKALIDTSELHIVVVEPEEEQVNSLRRSFDDSGQYGKRMAVIHDNPEDFSFPPYLAELILFPEGSISATLIEKAYSSLRPYGGKMYLPFPPENIRDIFSSLNLVNGNLVLNDNYALITREGALPGSSYWTHQYADSSNTACSSDELVKPPLGVLWFGGPSNLNTLPRHHNGPIPQVVGGHLFILGIDTLSARCVYTGRELWSREFPGIGHPFTSLEHERRFQSGQEVYMPNHPGANFIGSPYVSKEDGVYIIYKDKLFHLDPSSGEVKVEFRMPPLAELRTPEWGHLMVWENLLIATLDPQIFDDGEIGKENNWNATSSSVILVMDRYTGGVYWAKKAQRGGFRHNAMAAGNGKLFVIDGLSSGANELLQRRGVELESDSVLSAFDLYTGQELWREEEDVFGTWLSFYQDYNILVHGGRHGGRGVPPDEPRDRMNAHDGDTGEILWQYRESYTGPVALHPDMIVPGRPGQRALDPRSGRVILRENPLTGEEYRWSYHRYYGCGTMNASRYLLMFRSGAAGFHDLLNYGGTGNFGGFRSGCTNNLIAADGLLNAPDYTRTCTCSYQLQTSLGLVHMPEVEMWTLNRLERGQEPIRALGINLGAQGNRKENHVLWLEYPKMYAQGPDVPITITPQSHEWYRHHASWIRNPQDGYAWVASYGARGIDSLEIELVPDGSEEPLFYQVTLYFAEPDNAATGERVFDVSLQGTKVLENFDVVSDAGGDRKVVKKVFSDVPVQDTLKIEFSGETAPSILSGVEMVEKSFSAALGQDGVR